MAKPKSTIHLPAGRRVKSMPFTHGLRTSELGRPFGFAGRLSQSRAKSPGMSNAPALTSPMKAQPTFWGTFCAFVRSTGPAVKSELIRVTSLPSKRTGNVASFRPKHTSDTRTAAPSTTHGSFAQASKMTPCFTIRSSTARLRPPRIELVATRPARTIFLSTSNRAALSNQRHTKSASP